VSTNKFTNVVTVLILIASFLITQPVQALEWQNLWSTPEQRASRQLESEQYDKLIEQAPNANWRGVGEYRKGDYSAAIESFSQQRETAALAGSAIDAEQAMYNQANALTRNENYAEAIDLYDEVLELNPDHIDANHNRAIAEQLLEQQEQQQQDQQNSDGEPQDGEKSEGEEGEPSPSDQQEGDQEQSDQQESDQQQSDNNEDAQSANENAEQADASASQEEQAEQDAQAARAMAAEQAEDGSTETADNDPTGEVAPRGDEVAPAQLTEKEQANEQWLRQIPDDPAGLLQRKLQNRHLTDFPKVKDSVNPW